MKDPKPFGYMGNKLFGMKRTTGLTRGWYFLFGVFLSCAVLFVPAGREIRAAEAPLAVLGYRTAAHGDTVRVVFDLSRDAHFSVSIADSGRVFLDLPPLEWRAAAPSIGQPVGILKGIGIAKTGPDKARLVLETGSRAEVRKAFLLPPAEAPNHRLVIDLGSAGATAAPVSPAPAKPISAAKPLMPQTKTPLAVKPVVVIDPGHGGVDPGAISRTGIYEKTIVLDLALSLKAALDKGGRVKAVLTRDGDFFIPLRERVAIARSAKADLFLSLHADTVSRSQVRGLSVYTLSQTASDAEAQALADKENKADIVAGIDLSNEVPEVTNILIDLVQRETMNLSASFAVRLIREAGKEKLEILPVNPHRFAGFAVLKAPDVPSVLVETGYLSNPEDERMLRQPQYRAKLARALARAIESYFTETGKGRKL